MRRLGLVALVLGLAALILPAAVHGQCTAPESAELAANATALAEATAWPLPVPRNAHIDSLEDLRGALLLAGSVFQIERIVWQVTPAGNLDILEFEGYSREGVRTQVVKPAIGRPVESLADLTGFNLGNPRGKGRSYAVQSLELGTDAHGFLTVSRFQGVDRRSQKSVDADTPVGAACGLRVKASCDASQCRGACGAAPGCPCNGTSGACSGFSETVCSGDCPEGMVCNGSVNDCKCIPKPKPGLPVEDQTPSGTP